jgi:tetratricopeptide (TPR) repeat protein
MAKYFSNDFAGAIADTTAALARDSNDADAYRFRAAARYFTPAAGAAGDYQGTIADDTAALALNPKDTASLVRRGAAYLRLHRFREAIEDETAALTVDLQNAFAYRTRGFAHVGAGEYEQAVADLRSSLSYEPDNALAYEALGDALRALGRTAEASSAYASALRITPGVERVRRKADAVSAPRSAASAFGLDGFAWSPRGRTRIGSASTLDSGALYAQLMGSDDYLDTGKPEPKHTAPQKPPAEPKTAHERDQRSAPRR